MIFSKQKTGLNRSYSAGLNRLTENRFKPDGITWNTPILLNTISVAMRPVHIHAVYVDSEPLVAYYTRPRYGMVQQHSILYWATWIPGINNLKSNRTQCRYVRRYYGQHSNTEYRHPVILQAYCYTVWPRWREIWNEKIQARLLAYMSEIWRKKRCWNAPKRRETAE